jgi:threonine dehydrogenase-like Zn-dependent dehydrogenase
MKAVAVHPASQQVGLVEQAVPVLESRSGVKVRILEVGVCGTDKEICRFEYGYPPAGEDYLVLGHESLGEVVEIGPDVTSVQPGDLVVNMVRRPCHHAGCVPCGAQRQDFCTTGEYKERGINQLHGFMTGFVVEEEQYVCKVPRGLRDIAVLTEPLTIAEKALLQLESVQERLPWACPVTPGVAPASQYCHNAVVLGAGPVGLLGAMALRVRGFRTFVYSREDMNDPRVALCEQMGVEFISSATVSVDDMAARVGNIDVVYEATGYSPLSFDVMRRLGINGVFIFTGIPGRRPPMPVDTDLLMRDMVLKNQVILGTVNANRKAFENAIADLDAFQGMFPKAVSTLISRRYTIEEHSDLLLGKAGGIKNVISLDGAV